MGLSSFVLVGKPERRDPFAFLVANSEISISTLSDVDFDGAKPITHCCYPTAVRLSSSKRVAGEGRSRQGALRIRWQSRVYLS